MSFEEFQDLQETGYQGGSSEPIAPEDEFFKSIYIAGKSRKNAQNIEEQSGKFQIRGFEYNLDEVNMIITHTKDILVKSRSENGRDKLECFSFKEGAPPWNGTTKLQNGQQRECPSTSAERAAVDFCNACRAQIIVGGILCNSNGSPVLSEDKKPVFVFIRAKGMRYSNVSEYLNDRFNEEDLTPIFEPVTEQSKAFEKAVVNNKRFVTKLTKGTANTRYGSDVNVFVLDKGPELPKDAVMKILKLSKDTLEKFNDKFDWSKRKGATTSYTSAPAEGVLSTEATPATEATNNETVEEAKAAEPEKSEKVFSFDDIAF